MDKITIHFNQASEAMTLVDQDEIHQAIEVIKFVRTYNGTIWLCGNGGSHATASHFANDLVKIARVRAVCIGDSTPISTAYGNDNGWDNMYADHIKQVFMPSDGVVGISCGGNSQNVIEALKTAISKGGVAVGMTGLSSESKINKVGCNALIHVPVPDIRVQEDIHLMICHAIVRSLQGVE